MEVKNIYFHPLYKLNYNFPFELFLSLKKTLVEEIRKEKFF